MKFICRAFYENNIKLFIVIIIVYRPRTRAGKFCNIKTTVIIITIIKK